jgi:hypothetical protein
MTRLRLRRPKGECGRRQYLRIARRRTPHGGVQRRAPQNRRRNSQDRTLGSLSELNRWQRIIGDEPKRSQPGRKPSEHVGHRGPRTSCRGIVGGVPVSASVSDPTPCAAVHHRHRDRVTAPRHHASERPQRRRASIAMSSSVFEARPLSRSTYAPSLICSRALLRTSI